MKRKRVELAICAISMSLCALGSSWGQKAAAPKVDAVASRRPEHLRHGIHASIWLTLAGRFFVERYGWARWDRARVDASVAFAERWSKELEAPVYCGEFGVHRPFADARARARWIEDMRVALERHHLGWAMWDYQTNFGVVTKKDGVATPDEQVIRALGLRLAK